MLNKKSSYFYDAGGEKYKYPERTCKKCLKFLQGRCYVKNLGYLLDYAKYGCRKYEDGDKE